MQILAIPKVQLVIALVLISLTALNLNPIDLSLFLLLTSLFFTVGFDILFAYIRKRKLFTTPYAAIVTGLIIGLIVDTSSSWYQIATYAFLAMAAKNFIRVSNRHIFNPAAFGLFTGGIIFGSVVSWWGVSYQTIRDFNLLNLFLFLILLTPVYVSGYKLKRYFSTLTFLIAYTILSHFFLFSFSLESIIERLLDPVTLFFATVMLPEPMTSPVNSKRQIFYGLTVTSFAFIFSYPEINNFLLSNKLLPDIYVPALLLGNLLFFKYR